MAGSRIAVREAKATHQHTGDRRDARARFNDEGYGYSHEMGARPQTIA